MPEPLQGLCFFPGVLAVKSANYRLQHGITPGVCQMVIVPQLDFTAAGGDLEFAFGTLRLVFPDCKVDRFSMQRNDSGEVWTFQILDRRWRWAFAGIHGPLSGNYNLRGEDGLLEPAFEKTPQQLAALCLDALGERGYDVSQLPNDARPEVDWDREYPAQALQALVEPLGCRIVLRLDNRVQICRTGVGAALPLDEDVVENSLTIDPPERPDALLFIAGPSYYQAEFVLEPVGKDMDGVIKYIGDLSYKPAGGWHRASAPYFADVVPDRARRLAMETVYRWYRIDVTQNPDGTGPFELPGYGEIVYMDQLLPLDDLLNESVEDVDGNHSWLNASVFGTFWDEGTASSDTPERTVYSRDFEIDGEEGIVKFDRPVLRIFDLVGAKVDYPATLYLRCTCTVRDSETWALDRYEQERKQPGARWGTGAELVKSDDVYLRVVPEYDERTYKVKKITDNKADLRKEADYRLTAAELKYQTPLPQEIVYRGLKAISPDGAIQSVTFSVSDEAPGAQTRAARNDEFAIFAPSYEERRMRERIRANKVEETKQQAGKITRLALLAGKLV